ncbi:MAG TPA: thiamine pyrophosphate-requiring protein [Burkholderiales bacterium]|nr:thiamine pyrophosphate-requiring protein [Burkholderiales bacterium]
MDEPTIPIRPLTDTKPAAKAETSKPVPPAPPPKAESPQPKSQTLTPPAGTPPKAEAPQPRSQPAPQPSAPKIDTTMDPRIEPWLAQAAPKPEPGAFKPETAAEAWLGLLAMRGIEYLFANGGTDFAPVVEAYAKGQKLGWKLPQVVIVPHENMGIAMAHGYTMVTGRPQAMMVHVGVGTANALNGLINASRQNIPLLFTAGRTPLTESGSLPAARNNYIHWAQEHFDQGGMLREFMKWDYELRHAEQVETVIDRALAISTSEPQGPVYVTLPREVLASPFSTTVNSRAQQVAATAPAADAEALARAAKMLATAQHPLLITANGGRTLESARAIEHLAHALAVAVIHYRPRYLALSTEHPMHCGWDPHALLKEADVVLVVDCDVPWIPKEGGPRPEAKVMHIGADPLFARYPLRGFRTDLALTGAVAPTLEALWRAAQKEAPSVRAIENRRRSITELSDAIRKKARGGVEPTPNVITGKWLSACVNKLMDERTVLINEYPTVLEEMVITEPGRYYGNSSAGGLGWGLGAALGAKLATPEKTVICALGDGAYMFGNPTAGHYVSEAMHLPVLFVIANNARWAAVHRSTLATYPKGHAAATPQPPFATLEPSPRFEHVIQASGGHGERVTQPKQLMPALERALKVVKDEKRQALVNVQIEAGYVKTS